ncbi:hypothetical protein A1O1_01655 [Capronia coronata CBS 617.96]|uniref:amidase n=1 Tax=Capronia coronata CBS 617.96 TaxID=1182541 RepID=W9YL10_9EURO|nr:uncharacterized protein A1O1_01655 [Capronia coronata CBS 617.96]EXJ93263.1 hypothetical protein A1O1_01655 [Capronia coronata CBS 617.96]
MVSVGTDWKALASEKRDAVLAQIPDAWKIPGTISSADEVPDVTGPYIQQFLDAREIMVTETDAVGIVEKTSSGEWTAVEVTKAFCHRAALAHQLVNCLHEICFDAAIENAQQLDTYFAEYKQPVGPLHGLPVSLKDQFHIKGIETTMGYVGWIGTFQGNKDDPRRFTFESELVKELRNLGAVLYCKTSVPTTLMTTETVNNILGYTWNPRNRHLSSGGSSGGEAALIALKGSPGGFGTDIGGSVRIPASYNGLWGLRPCGRLPYEGAATSIDGQNTVLSVVGPLSSSLGGLKLLFKAILQQQPWLHDPMVIEIPWREPIVEETQRLITKAKSTPGVLAFGLLRHDGIVHPTPPVARALGSVVSALRQAGHKIIEWDPPSHKLGAKILMDALTADGGADVRYHLGLSGEPQPEQIGVNRQQEEQKNVLEVAAINIAKREYKKAYLEYWNSTKDLTDTGRPVDAVLCPVTAHSPITPNKSRSMEYTLVSSLLDYTAVVIPVTHVKKEVDLPHTSMEYLSEWDKLAQTEYDPKVHFNGPVGIQLLGRCLEEEKMLTLAEYIKTEVLDR